MRGVLGERIGVSPQEAALRGQGRQKRSLLVPEPTFMIMVGQRSLMGRPQHHDDLDERRVAQERFETTGKVEVRRSSVEENLARFAMREVSGDVGVGHSPSLHVGLIEDVSFLVLRETDGGMPSQDGRQCRRAGLLSPNDRCIHFV